MSTTVPLRRVLSRSREANVDGMAPLLSLTTQGEVIPRSGEDGLGSQAPSTESVPKYLLVRPGQLVVNPMWLVGGSVGVASRAGAVSPAYRVYDSSSLIDPRYLHHVVRSLPMRVMYQVLARGETTFDRSVNAEDFESLELTLLSLEEQRRIADFLDDRVTRIDQIITARKRQSSLVEEAFLARMRAGVAGALNDDDATEESEIAWIERRHSSAVAVSLARVVTLQRGVDLTDQQRRPGDVPVITTAGVVGAHDEAVARGPGVVIGRYGSVGNVHWVEGPYWPHNTTLYVKNAHGNDMRWIYYLLRSFPYASMQARAAVPGINRNDMATESVPWIPVTLQRQAVDLLVEDERASLAHRRDLDASVALLTEFKQSLITAAVSGELDVSTARSGIPG